ncbi:MAG: hypothetical protein P0111_06710 [Nitrospira sp.]|nr:hypothetical protein [Nitrospira sp.]
MGNPTRTKQIPWKNVVSRIAAAAFGGYTLTYTFTACLTLLLPLSKTEAVLTAAMFSFVLYTGAIVWAFAASTPRRAWVGLLSPAFGCGVIVFPLFPAVVR